MKGIILHGGHGTRLRPLTHTGPKQLLKIANKPMSQYALEDLRGAGITDIAVIIGDVYPEKVKEFYGDGTNFGVNLTYIYQDQPKGIAHAISLCENFVGNDKFVVYLGDNILRKGLQEYTKKFESSNPDAMILLCEVDNPSQFGVAELDGKKIKKISEKPKIPSSNLAVIGVYFLTSKIFKIIKNLKPSWRNELEITEALQLLMDEGNIIEYDVVSGWWKDTGTPEDILHANQLILDTISSKHESKLNTQSIDEIIVGNNTKINKTQHRGPIIIGENCVIDSSVKLGPYVSIGNNVLLRNCSIKNSIIMDGCIVDSKITITDSIIANDTEIHHSASSNKVFLLGERSKIEL
jgi:glucose-1-phosphate thymidylyltransferase